ncbi:MAG: hypothetical protein HY922_11410 [Elusimicrobia bacterium]|nr:hypothetical protein [Elusimicrobiota bacterium]
MSSLWLFLTLMLVVVVIGGWALKHWIEGDEPYQRDIARLGLKEFNDRLREDIAQGRRPPQDGEITHRMKWMLEELENTQAQEGTIGLITPHDETDRLACEELVKMGRLMKTPDFHYAVVIRKKGA